MKDRMLSVTVKTDIHKFVTESMQCDYIKCSHDSTLITVVKPHLCLEPDDWELEPVPDGYTWLKIELPDLRQVYEARNGKVYYCDTLFRDHITRKGLVKVRRFLWKTYNAKFNAFLAGWTERQHVDNETAERERRVKVTDGIVAFFNNYHIDFDNKLIESRRQAWVRYMKKTEEYRQSPVAF